MKDIVITYAATDDVKEIVPVHMRAWLKTYPGLVNAEYLKEKTDPKSYDDKIKKRIELFREKEGEIFLVAKIEGKVVGFLDGGSLLNNINVDKEIWGLYVDPDYHRMGVGRALFNFFVDIVCAQGAKTIGVGCLRDNKNSVAFYKKMGGKFLKESVWKYAKGEAPETFFIFDI